MTKRIGIEISSQYVDELRTADELDWSDIEALDLRHALRTHPGPLKRRKPESVPTTPPAKDIKAHRPPRPSAARWIASGMESPPRAEDHAASDRAVRRRPGKRVEPESSSRASSTVSARSQSLTPPAAPATSSTSASHLLKDLEQEVLAYGRTGPHRPAAPRSPPPAPRHRGRPYATSSPRWSSGSATCSGMTSNGFGLATRCRPRAAREHPSTKTPSSTSPTRPPARAEWPAADSSSATRPSSAASCCARDLGDDYVDALFRVWDGRVRPRGRPLLLLVREGARADRGRQDEAGRPARHPGHSRRRQPRVLKRIKDTGDIFFAVADRDWMLDGAAVHVSMVGFDNGAETARILDGSQSKV